MIKRVFRNLYFLTFLNGFLLASLFYFKMEASYEGELFNAIQSNINSKITKSSNEDSVVIKVMQACNSLLSEREPVFANQALNGFKAGFLRPTTIDLMTAEGACGSYAVVLARIFENYNYPVRIAQMKANGVYAAHNIVEVKTKKGWVVLDALYNVCFIKPGGSGLASFNDVKNNWDYYKQQLPARYNQEYRYEDVRYTNWEKVPVLLPGIKKVLDLALGKEKADTVSIRTYFLKKYDVYFYLILIIFIPVFIITLRRLIQTKVFPQPNIPFTFSNIIRHLKARISGNKQSLSKI